MSELVYGKIDLLNTSLGKITLQYTGTVAKINFVFSQKKVVNIVFLEMRPLSNSLIFKFVYFRKKNNDFFKIL